MEDWNPWSMPGQETNCYYVCHQSDGGGGAMTNLSARESWRAVLGDLELQIPKQLYDSYLKQTEGIGYDESTFTVRAPSAFVVTWLERRMYSAIQGTLEKVTGKALEIRFDVLPVDQEPGLAPLGLAHDRSLENGYSPEDVQGWAPTRGVRVESRVDIGGPLVAGAGEGYPAPPGGGPGFAPNPKYTFDSYVVGPSNRLAYSAAQAVADAPGESYNPLFLYSGVGLGKTHLLYAVGQACAEQRKSVLYVTSEQFTNEFLSAIRNRSTEDFRNRYREVEVLLIDDVQFMSGKEQTQESFFHTFNDLHNSGRQIVISSDRPPKALALLEDRLRSRFEWGLIADIQPPDLETRMAILSAKAEEMCMDLPDDIVEMVAKRVQRNVRELEGCLNRLMLHAKTMSEPITTRAASAVLNELTTATARRSVEPDQIIDEVGRHFGVTREELLGKVRRKMLSQARQVAMYLLMYELQMSPTQVGRLLGGRDHATVIHGAGKINGEINEDPQLRQTVLTVKEALFA